MIKVSRVQFIKARRYRYPVPVKMYGRYRTGTYRTHGKNGRHLEGEGDRLCGEPLAICSKRLSTRFGSNLCGESRARGGVCRARGGVCTRRGELSSDLAILTIKI